MVGQRCKFCLRRVEFLKNIGGHCRCGRITFGLVIDVGFMYNATLASKGMGVLLLAI